MIVFLYIHCLWTILSSLVMKVLPYDPTSSRGQEIARIGETAGIHSLEIRPSIKQSHPSKSVDLASASREASPMSIQFTILTSPLPRRYVLIASAISVLRSVLDIQSNTSCTEIWNICTRPEYGWCTCPDHHKNCILETVLPCSNSIVEH
jgi:hypothetical protein